MEAKEYLEQLKLLGVKIHNLQQEKRELLESFGNISSPDMSKERVAGGNATSDAAFVDLIIKKMGIEVETNLSINDYYDLKHIIIGQIHNLQNANHIK
ncbi:MAG: DUF1492 domain-containing protein, partial [Ruminococcus sp.]|nr:DUF1492 domain-containing protein [Ruminococcus sp.]